MTSSQTTALSGDDDHIKVHGISVVTTLDDTPWSEGSRPSKQQVIIDVDVVHPISASAQKDDYTLSVDYSAICARVQQCCTATPSDSEIGKRRSAHSLAEALADLILAQFPVQKLSVEFSMPKIVLRSQSAGLHITRPTSTSTEVDVFTLKDLRLYTVIGARSHERHDKQPLVINVTMKRPPALANDGFSFASLERRVIEVVEVSSYLTVEALASDLAQSCLRMLRCPHTSVTIGIAKPAVLTGVFAPEIVITRTLRDYRVYDTVQTKNSESSIHNDKGQTLAIVALGSNLGDRFRNIELALRHLECPTNADQDRTAGDSDKAVTVLDTSFLYETAPMYVTEQPEFINGACLVETTLRPRELLEHLKHVEHIVGRVPSMRNGPRAVDLDILYYGDLIIDTRPQLSGGELGDSDGQLVLPHPRLSEREFVLRPLNDIAPDWVDPVSRRTVRELLSVLVEAKSPNEPSMNRVMPFPRLTGDPHAVAVPDTLTYWTLPLAGAPVRGYRTRVMATLNVTPDSFSDGSDHMASPAALKYVESALASGADIIDIGGYSTRPGASPVSPSEETARVVPVIQAIRASPSERTRNALISVDTFRPEVARAALFAGANCINDVTALTGADYPPSAASDANFEAMKHVARQFNAPVVMMHSRGDAGSNKDYAAYAAPGALAVLDGVRVELGTKVDRAVRGPGGLRRWQVLVDPGIGFSKSVEGNLELLRNAARLTEDTSSPVFPSLSAFAGGRNPLAGFPQLIGASRKSFLGALIAPECEDAEGNVRARAPRERDFATAAAVACAVQLGAAVVRVHEVQGMVDVVKVAEALWR